MSLAVNPGGEVPTGIPPLADPELLFHGPDRLPESVDVVDAGEAAAEVPVDIELKARAAARESLLARRAAAAGTPYGRRRMARAQGSFIIAAAVADRMLGQLEWDEE
jgi:hypothetical protein